MDKLLYKIHVGLKDSETGVQKYTIEKYLSVLKHICSGYKVGFSVQVMNGGYFHENGSYTEENTLRLELADIEEEVVTEIAKDLCAFFNQESVMVTASTYKTLFVKDTLKQ